MIGEKLKLVVSSGAGISAESGISTFRDSDGLWEQYEVMDVASADGFRRNPELIHRFYNARRAALAGVQPNRAHKILHELEEHFDVRVITQNVDDLHERAGSSNVLHLHGELLKVRAMDNERLIFDVQANTETTPDTLFDGHRVRPHIVFFQESVPNFEPATSLAAEADIFVIVGTSLVVYPAAALLHYVRRGVPVYYIDPNPNDNIPEWVTVIPRKATDGVQELANILLNTYIGIK